MEAEELADELNGMEYGDDIQELKRSAKENNLVIVYGASDDLMEVCGAIDEEIGCCDGGTVYLDEHGLIVNKCESENCPCFIDAIENARFKIEAKWCEVDDYSWTYETEIVHSTFDIMEDGEKYCRGIVFSMGDIK